MGQGEELELGASAPHREPPEALGGSPWGSALPGEPSQELAVSWATWGLAATGARHGRGAAEAARVFCAVLPSFHACPRLDFLCDAMTSALESQAQEIFRRAMELDVEGGSQYIDDACGQNLALKEEVLRIMNAEADSSFEEIGGLSPLDTNEPALMAPARDGEWIGAFRIIRTIGSGGMGIVYEAEQEYPERRVALKVLPASLGQPAAEQRFHTEVQLLARIDHPGVARMLEAGVHTAEDGAEQPYFAMEFVPDASDLIHWGESRGLTDRLDVFVSICDAVQQGHQQGVVHRDLKPANVLVGSGDAPKVIDFGVAGVIEGYEGNLSTRATQAGDIVGTLQYMAPEQLEGTLRVDTRTDIYALGLLLYELVSGELPFDLAGRSISEIVTIIREEPLRRQLSAVRRLPEDLWWVILRATEKEPARRYATASELAADLRRFMRGLPVEAARPSRLYAFKKLVQRNKSATAAVALVLISVIAGTAISVVAMLEAAREAENFRSMNGVLTGMFQDVRADAGGANITAVELLDRAAERVATFVDRPDLEAALRVTLAKSYASLGHFDSAVREGTRALELRREMTASEEVGAARYLADSLLRANRIEEAEAVLKRYGETWFTEHPDAAPLHRLSLARISASIAHRRGRPDAAVAALEILVAKAEAFPSVEGTEDDARATLNDLESALVLALLGAGRHREAERRIRIRIKSSEKALGVSSASDALLLPRAQLGKSLMLQQRFKEGAEVLEAIFPAAVAALGEQHTHTLVIMTDLAAAYTATGEAARAIPILEEVLRARDVRDGPEHPDTLIAKMSLADARAKVGDGGAEALLRESVEMRDRVYGRDDARTLFALRTLCQFLRKRGRLDEAEPLHVDLYERSQRVYTDDKLELHRAGAALGLLRLMQGRAKEATALIEPAWRGYQRHADEGDTEVLAVANNLAGSLAEQARWGEAIDVFAETYVKMRAVLEPDDQRLATVLLNIATLHANQGEMGLSLERFHEALDWAIEHLPESHPERLHIAELNGYQLVAMGRAAEAVPLYRELVRASQLNPKLNAVQRSTFRLGHARCLVAAGEHGEAVEALQTVIEMERTRVGDADPDWLAGLEAELKEARRLAADAATAEVD